MNDTMIILGSCGSAREAYWVVYEAHPDMEIVFLNDLPEAKETNCVQVGGRSVPVIHDWDFTSLRRDRPNAFRNFVCGMGDPVIKRIMVQRALSEGLTPAPTIVSPAAFMRPDCTLGYGGVVHPGACLYTNVHFGDYVTFFCARCGHDCVYGDYVTCTGGCNIAGHVVVGEGSHLGLGTAVQQRVHIAPWVTVGMHSAIISDLNEPGIVAFGTPAKKVREIQFPQAFLDTYPPDWYERLRNNAAT